MEKREILRKFLDKGYQLDPSSLDFFLKNSEKIEEFLEKMDKIKTKPLIITLDFISSLLEKVQKKPEIEVIRSFEPKKSASVSEVISFFYNRYERIRSFFTGRLELVNLISINKITPRTKKFSLIGMVREKYEKVLVLEDLTGEITVSLTEDDILLDDVIGVVCEQDSTIKAKNIIFPDIPLRREIARAKEDVYCLFISDIHMNETNFEKDSYLKFLDWLNEKKFGNLYIFVLGDVSSKKSDLIDFFNSLPKNSFKVFLKGEKDPKIDVADLNLSDIALIQIEKSILALISHGSFLGKYSDIWKDPEQIMLNLLKRRNIDPTFDGKIYDKDPFVLDVIPDIFVSGHFHSPAFLNYKGTTILSTGSFLTKPIFWLTNLKTRETIELDFT